MQHDVGMDTIRIPLESPTNQRCNSRQVANLWLIVGVILLICDSIAMAHFANDTVEASIIAALSMPTGILVIVAALEARK
jgi:hypothetical protein